MALIKGTQVALASETVRGTGEIATQAETDAGTDDARLVTPLKLATHARLAGAIPAAPAAGYVRQFVHAHANRAIPAHIDEHGTLRPVGSALWAQDWGAWMPAASNVQAVGATVGVNGTASTPTPATTSARTRMRRVSMTQTAGTDVSCGIRTTTRMGLWLGDAAGVGGFFQVFRVGLGSNLAGQRAFVGLLASTSAISGGSNPSAFTDMIGLAFDDTADASDNWQIMHNDGSGTATAVDLGTDFQRNTTDAIEVCFFAPPNASSVYYTVLNLTTGIEASGTLSTNLPAGTTNLLQHVWTNSGSTNGAPIIDCGLQYYEIPRYGELL